jgi:hypothetical protein
VCGGKHTQVHIIFGAMTTDAEERRGEKALIPASRPFLRLSPPLLLLPPLPFSFSLTLSIYPLCAQVIRMGGGRANLPVVSLFLSLC